MPNLVKKFREKVGFLWGAKKPSPAQLELKNTPRDIGLNWYIFRKNQQQENMIPIPLLVFHFARDFGNAKSSVNLITK